MSIIRSAHSSAGENICNLIALWTTLFNPVLLISWSKSSNLIARVTSTQGRGWHMGSSCSQQSECAFTEFITCWSRPASLPCQVDLVAQSGYNKLKSSIPSTILSDSPHRSLLISPLHWRPNMMPSLQLGLPISSPSCFEALDLVACFGIF